MHLPFQKVKKNIVWGMYTDWDNKKNKNKRKKKQIQAAHTILLNQFIFCKEEVVATHD